MKKSLLIITIVMTVFASLPAFCYNPQDLLRLQQTCSCRHCDLSGANLTSFKLGDRATLIAAKATVDENGFIRCDISQSNFSHANLTNAYFSPSDFAPGIHDKVIKVIMNSVNFSSTILTAAHFNAVNADHCNFYQAQMQNASIMKAASFRYCNFSQADLNQLSVTPPMGGCGANFSYSNFASADLSNSKINADFTAANCSYTNFANAQLIPCDEVSNQAFKATNFYAANLKGVHLANGQAITANDLVQAKLCRTLFLQGVNNRNCYHP